ncbi:MAG TPA: GNAT family N-acetyltransferase [Novosphingobium sp.]|nr:GNAT family N-acetyltransferase [Novosphingobium sp.]
MQAVELAGTTITVRAFEPGDRAALERFARALPSHDLLFLSRDLRQPKVIEAWLAATAGGEIDSLVAWEGADIVATTASIRDPLGWSPQVCEIRLLVLPVLRGKGLGQMLLERCVEAAIAGGATKLVARMTPDQVGAITLFEESGFRAEALLRDQVRDEAGTLHDLAILSLDPGRSAARQAAFS